MRKGITEFFSLPYLEAEGSRKARVFFLPFGVLREKVGVAF